MAEEWLHIFSTVIKADPLVTFVLLEFHYAVGEVVELLYQSSYSVVSWRRDSVF